MTSHLRLDPTLASNSSSTDSKVKCSLHVCRLSETDQQRINRLCCIIIGNFVPNGDKIRYKDLQYSVYEATSFSRLTPNRCWTRSQKNALLLRCSSWLNSWSRIRCLFISVFRLRVIAVELSKPWVHKLWRLSHPAVYGQLLPGKLPTRQLPFSATIPSRRLSPTCNVVVKFRVMWS